MTDWRCSKCGVLAVGLTCVLCGGPTERRAPSNTPHATVIVVPETYDPQSPSRLTQNEDIRAKRLLASIEGLDL